MVPKLATVSSSWGISMSYSVSNQNISSMRPAESRRPEAGMSWSARKLVALFPSDLAISMIFARIALSTLLFMLFPFRAAW